VKYQVIGVNDVAVPTCYFKIILKEDGTPLESFVLLNESIAAETPLRDFMTTIEKVEKMAGLIFNL
jgi:DNA/RNA endonuclease G (NUC1)